MFVKGYSLDKIRHSLNLESKGFYWIALAMDAAHCFALPFHFKQFIRTGAFQEFYRGFMSGENKQLPPDIIKDLPELAVSSLFIFALSMLILNSFMSYLAFKGKNTAKVYIQSYQLAMIIIYTTLAFLLVYGLNLACVSALIFVGLYAFSLQNILSTRTAE
jgi:hypothetical protein